MPQYEFKHVPDTPLTRVYVDGVPDEEFTSLYAAQCYVEHRSRLDRQRETHDENSGTTGAPLLGQFR